MRDRRDLEAIIRRRNEDKGFSSFRFDGVETRFLAICLLREMQALPEDSHRLSSQHLIDLACRLDEAERDDAEISTADINNLPDDKFLYIESGGTKDKDGKTVPRSLRHFPVPDVAHIRNALARIPQSNLSEAVKKAATEKAQKMLETKKDDLTDPDNDGDDDTTEAGDTDLDNARSMQEHGVFLLANQRLMAHKHLEKAKQMAGEMATALGADHAAAQQADAYVAAAQAHTVVGNAKEVRRARRKVSALYDEHMPDE